LRHEERYPGVCAHEHEDNMKASCNAVVIVLARAAQPRDAV